MIEITVLRWLADALDVPVSLEVPQNPPERFVTIQKTGSGLHNKVDVATFAVQSWAQSKYDAASLNEAVKASMAQLDASGLVGESALNSDYDYTDAGGKHYRYQAVFDLTY